jgi:lipoprotein-anchoring transpeptidase ErfK/SrfK
MLGQVSKGRVVIGVVALLTAACSASTPSSTRSNPASPHAARALPPPQLALTPSDGSSGISLDQALSATAAGGTIESVSVKSDGSVASLDGTLSPDHTQWTYTGGLDAGTTYVLTVLASNANGDDTTASSTFTTIASVKRLLTTLEYINDGATVGVGMPIDLRFNTSIPVSARQNLLAHIGVESSPAQAGGWFWAAPDEVHYRPETYWQSGTHVTVVADLKGVNAGNGYWGLGDWSQSFTVGAAHFAVVNTKTRVMRIYNGDPSAGGQLIGTWPVNTGKPGFYTINGTLIVLYHTPVVVMDSCSTFHTVSACTPGGSNYYHEAVTIDSAISTDGYFVHDAYWACPNDSTCNAVYPYGQNTSHGCVNLSPDHARFFYNWSQVGDVVEVTGSPWEASYSDGEGDWQTPWSDYVQGGQDVSGQAASSSTPSSTPPTSSATPTPSGGRP